MIDMSDVLLDPDFTELFTVIRRVETVSAADGVARTDDTRTDNVAGTICAAHPNDLERLDDNQRMGRNLSVVTTFQLRGPSPGYQPDYIVWRGDTYIVKLIDPYPQFGQFVQAIIGSIDAVDRPVPGLGQAELSDPSQSDITAVL